MNILIHSNNIYFNIGIAQCFRDIQKTAPELKVIHSLPLSHLPELSGLDVIILSLENYHDYLAAAEIAQHFQGLVIGFTSAGNVRRGRSFFADTLLWVSQREAVREVSRLLRCLAERRWPLVPLMSFLIDVSWYSLVALVLSADRPRRVYLRLKRRIDIATATVLGALGLRLIATSLTR